MNSRGDIARMSLPSNSASPPVASCSRISVSPTVVLPEPDSPTRPSVLPFGSRNDTSFTASNLRRPNKAFARVEVLAEALHVEDDRSDAAMPRLRSVEIHGVRAAVHEILDHRQPDRPPVEPRPACSSALVYGSCGCSNTCFAGPCSRISPLRITTT